MTLTTANSQLFFVLFSSHLVSLQNRSSTSLSTLTSTFTAGLPFIYWYYIFFFNYYFFLYTDMNIVYPRHALFLRKRLKWATNTWMTWRVCGVSTQRWSCAMMTATVPSSWCSEPPRPHDALLAITTTLSLSKIAFTSLSKSGLFTQIWRKASVHSRWVLCTYRIVRLGQKLTRFSRFFPNVTNLEKISLFPVH